MTYRNSNSRAMMYWTCHICGEVVPPIHHSQFVRMPDGSYTWWDLCGPCYRNRVVDLS